MKAINGQICNIHKCDVETNDILELREDLEEKKYLQNNREEVDGIFLWENHIMHKLLLQVKSCLEMIWTLLEYFVCSTFFL